MKAVILSVRSPIRRPSLRLGSRLIPVLLVCFGLAPTAQAVDPDADGAIPGSNNGEGIATATPIDASGIAARYRGDKNIASHPAVIFADDFESYTSPNQLTNNWDAAYQLPNIRIATEPNNVYSGSKSLEFSLPISTNEVSNAAKKTINPTQDTVFIRAYTKFDPGYQVTGSNHNGLRLSAQYPGPGRRPPPDGTGFFLFTLQNLIAGNPRPGESAPGFTHLYSYWPRQRSAFGDHWYPTGLVVPFRSGIGEDGQPIGNRGDWLAFPSQYPDFNPRANFLPQRGRWYCYELMVRANTPGQNNGEVKFWIDGTVIGDFPNLFVRSISTLKIDEALIGLHARRSDRVNKKWYDNVVIATQYIGPMVSAPARGDFNGDGKADILWQNSSTGQRVIWLMNGTALQSTVSLGTVATSWSITGSGDFNGDGKADILWQNNSTGQRLIWIMNGITHTSTVSLGFVATSWSIAGSSDFNGDGKSDILWQNTSTGQRLVWLMNGTTRMSTVSLGFVPTAWSIVGSSDFNGDGKPDILWQNTSSGQRLVWLMNDTTPTSAVSLGFVPTAWSIVGSSDFNGDGKPDILWQNNSTGQRVIWIMNGTIRTSNVGLGTVWTSWNIRNY
jgi:FG-GAP-like repeat